MGTSAMKLEEVFGVSNNELSTYIERKEVDDCFKNALKQKRQIIIYGSSKQGKTTLLNKHVKNDKMIKIQCSPNLALSDIYQMVIKQLKIKVESSQTNETHNDNKIKFNFMVQIPTLTKAGLEMSKTKGQKESVTTTEIDITNAQNIAELINNLS